MVSHHTSTELYAFTLNLQTDALQLAFFTLGIASAISTAIIVKAVDTVNKYGADIGIAAYKGNTFLGMTWAATALMLLASVVWLAQCCVGRRKGASPDKGAS